MLGKRKREQKNSTGQSGTTKKKWQEEIKDDDEDSDLESQLLAGELDFKTLKGDQKFSQEDPVEAEFERKRMLEQERQDGNIVDTGQLNTELLRQELREELKKKDEEENLEANKGKPEILEEQDEILGKGAENSAEIDERTLFVQNLHPEATEDDVRSLFQEFGQIRNIDLMKVEGLAYNKGRCFVEFENVSQAEEAAQAVNGRLEYKGKLLQAQRGVSTAAQLKVMGKVNQYVPPHDGRGLESESDSGSDQEEGQSQDGRINGRERKIKRNSNVEQIDTSTFRKQ